MDNWQQPEVKEGIPTKWGWMVQGVKNFKLGKNTDIGFGTYIQARAGVTIEDDVQIGSHCAIYSQSTIDGKEGKVILKKGCKIGTHSVIMPNVTVNEGATIGACSFVNKNVPAGWTVCGVPARLCTTRDWKAYV